MRREPTKEEALLWGYLRDTSLMGFKFYRQYPIGRYIADFCCKEKNLIIELDGGIHATQKNREYDDARDKAINAYGLQVVRFTNEQLDSDTETVIDRIKSLLITNIPLPQNGGGERGIREVDSPGGEGGGGEEL